MLINLSVLIPVFNEVETSSRFTASSMRCCGLCPLVMS